MRRRCMPTSNCGRTRSCLYERISRQEHDAVAGVYSAPDFKMNLNAVLVFCHILGAIGLFVVLAFERLALTRLQGARNREQASEWIGVWTLLPRLRLPSVLLILIPALYWTFTAWRGIPWVYISLVAVLAASLAGKFMSTSAFEHLDQAIKSDPFPSPDDLPTAVWGRLWPRRAATCISPMPCSWRCSLSSIPESDCVVRPDLRSWRPMIS